MTPIWLLIFAVSATLVVVEGTIFQPFRRGPKLWVDLVTCPLCLGVWVGWGMWLAYLGRLPEGRLEWFWALGFGLATGVAAYLVRLVMDVLDALDDRPNP